MMLGRHFELADVHGYHIRFALLQLEFHTVIVFDLFLKAGHVYKGFLSAFIMMDEAEAFQLVKKFNRSG